MKTILSFLLLICTLQINAQLASLSEKSNTVDKSGFNLQLNTTNGFSVNYENKIFQKGKYSLWGTAGIGSHLPGLRKNLSGEGLKVATPLGFSANLELSNRWRFNQSHSIHLTAGVQRFQFYQPDKFKNLIQQDGYNPLSKYLELEYRYEPKHSKMFFTAGYRHSFNNNSQFGRLNFGVGFKF